MGEGKYLRDGELLPGLLWSGKNSAFPFSFQDGQIFLQEKKEAYEREEKILSKRTSVKCIQNCFFVLRKRAKKVMDFW